MVTTDMLILYGFVDYICNSVKEMKYQLAMLNEEIIEKYPCHMSPVPEKEGIGRESSHMSGISWEPALSAGSSSSSSSSSANQEAEEDAIPTSLSTAI